MRTMTQHSTRKQTVFFTAAVLLGFFASATLFAAEDSTENGADEPAVTQLTGPVELFNGKTLDGWRVFVRGQEPEVDPKGVFSVADGAIRISGEEYGGLTTVGAYADYRLTVEFKWGEKTWGNRKDRARDSGVLIHSYGKQGGFGSVWAKSVEANVIEGGLGDFWMVSGPDDGLAATADVTVRSGVKIFDPENGKPVTITENAQGCFGWFGRDPEWKDVLGFRGKNDLDRPGDWNELTVVARGDVMETFVNGTLVNRVYGLKRTAGTIQLQSEGAEIFYRKLTIAPLE